MKRSSLSRVIMAGLYALIIVSMLALLASFVAMRSASRTTSTFSEFVLPINDGITLFIDNLWEMRLNARSFLYDANDASYQSSIAAGEELKQQAKQVSDLARSNPAGTALLEQIERFATDTAAYQNSMTQSLQVTHDIEQTLADINKNAAEFYAIAGEFGDWIANYQNEQAGVLSTAEFRTILVRTNAINADLSYIIADVGMAVAATTEAQAMRDIAKFDVAKPALTDLQEKLTHLQGLVVLPRPIEYAGQLSVVLTDLNANLAKMTELVNLLFVQDTERRNIGNEMIADVDALNQATTDIGVNQSGALMSLMSTVEMAIIGAIALLVIVGAAATIVIRKKVINRLKTFVDAMANFTSGDGDLTKRIQVTSSDELGQLGEYVNVFVESIQGIVQQVKTAADDLASGNTQLAATMEELSTTFNLQSEQVSTVASNMGVMNETSQGIVNTVQQGLDAMGKTDSSVQNGNGELHNVMDTMESIKGQTSQLSNTIKQLTESSVQIGEILTVISGIADQTNLLALNAAIEAARAGEAGRGFAVVADEVRKLAEGTQRSTNEITAIINKLQKDTSDASNEMSKTVDSVGLGMDGISQTGSMMDQIVSASGNASASLGSISSEINNQFGMMNEMSDSTQGLASGIEESVHAVSEVTATVSHLQNQAETLKAIVSQFRV